MLVYRDLLSQNIDNKSYINYSIVKTEIDNIDNYVEQYFTIKCVSTSDDSAQIHFQLSGYDSTALYALEHHLYYQVEGSTSWNDYKGLTGIQVIPGKTYKFKGNWCPSSDGKNVKILTTNCTIDIYGNIMSLIYNDSFIGKDTLNSISQFEGLFAGCVGLRSIDNLKLPATTLTKNCYRNMFDGCVNLKLSSVKDLLPASDLPYGCYSFMFSGCTSLICAPNLGSKENNYFINGNYVSCSSMFAGCTSLKHAPKIINCNTIKGYMCQSMFNGCSSLEKAPSFSSNITSCEENGCDHMFNECSSLLECPDLSNILNISNRCYEYMFRSCTSLTKTCNLPATTIANECYREMFNGCSSITEICSLPALSVPEGAYHYMFHNCVSILYGIELPATTIGKSAYYGMFQNCQKMKTCTSSLPATVLPEMCYRNMYQGCNSLSILPNITCTSIEFESCRHMFDGCIGVVDGPILRLSALKQNSCAFMFNGCSNLRYIKIVCPNISADSCLQGWLNNVASTGVLVRNDGINPPKPLNWTTYIELN